MSIFLDQVPAAFWADGIDSTQSLVRVIENVATSMFGSTIDIGNAFSQDFFDFSSVSDGNDRVKLSKELQFYEQLVVGSSVAVSSTVSVGYAVWMLRGGSLLTTFMSSIRAWQAFDHLPILDGRRNDDEEDVETLASLVSQQHEGKNAPNSLL